MRLWIESAYQRLPGLEGEAAGDYVRTLTTENQFLAFCASSPGQFGRSSLAAGPGWDGWPGAFQEVVSGLESGQPLAAVAETLLSRLPQGVHLPVAVLQVGDGNRASLVECDAPPLFMTRGGRLVLLPVVEEDVGGRLVRRCEFDLQDGDHMAMVSEGFLQGVRWDRRLGWRDIAVATRRLTETRCDAGQLAGALMRQYQRMVGRGSGLSEPEAESGQGTKREAEEPPTSPAFSIRYPVSVLAMFVRPMRTLTLWSGPPASRAAEREVLGRLIAEEQVRVICGDTTAEIAARLLGADLIVEPRPPDGWREVPPASQMIGPDGAQAVDLVTEGVVTMTVARERLASARDPRDLAGRKDGASRLAQLLLTADRVRFLVGLAVNPVQVAADGTPLRRVVVNRLVEDLRARGKIVSVECF